MINFKNINKFSILYFIIHRLVGFAFQWIFYKRVIILNKKNIPENKAVIIAPNHQNALMDALAIVTSFFDKTIFLARSDIFKKPLVARLLVFCRIMPVYRMRDGIESLHNNQETFDMSSLVLRTNNRLTLLPEGNHAGFRKLRQLKKGIARIAFQAAEETNYELDIVIIPTGLDYSNYENIRGTLIVNFGEPINLKDYYALYRENAPKAMLLVMEELRRRIIQLMVHIDIDEYYHTINEARLIYARELNKKENKPNNALNLFNSSRKAVDIINKKYETNPEIFPDLKSKVHKYSKLLKKFNFKDWVIAKGQFSYLNLVLYSFLMIFGLPLHIFGVINNYIPYKIADAIGSKIKDPQFRSSFKFAIAVIAFPLFYILLLFALLLVDQPSWFKHAYLATCSVTGFFAINYWIWTKKLVAMWNFTLRKSFKNDKLNVITQLRNDIINIIEK